MICEGRSPPTSGDRKQDGAEENNYENERPTVSGSWCTAVGPIRAYVKHCRNCYWMCLDVALVTRYKEFIAHYFQLTDNKPSSGTTSARIWHSQRTLVQFVTMGCHVKYYFCASLGWPEPPYVLRPEYLFCWPTDEKSMFVSRAKYILQSSNRVVG